MCYPKNTISALSKAKIHKMNAMQPKYDLILLGATGYTGKLFVQYMVEHFSTDRKWAIAGRNKSKLEDVAQSMGVTEAGGAVISLDLSSESEITTLVRSTRVLINIIGPYATTCGSLVFKACAENGTSYVDGAGEPVWRQDMIKQFEDVAKASGAKMVITCGWGAVPADISTYVAVDAIRQNFSLPTQEVVGALYDINGSASGGAVDSVCTTISGNRLSRILSAIKFDSISPVKPLPHLKSKTALPAMNIFGVQTIQGLGTLTTHFHEPVDLPLIGRSWGLYETENVSSLPGYGPNFRFSSRIRLPGALASWAFRTACLMFAACMLLPPTRFIFGKWLFPPGSGASAEQRRKYHFTYRAVGVGDTIGAKKPKVLVEFKYPGDANEFTAMAMTEAALLLLEPDSRLGPRRSGILTPASLGPNYVTRLKKEKVDISTSLV